MSTAAEDYLLWHWFGNVSERVKQQMERLPDLLPHPIQRCRHFPG